MNLINCMAAAAVLVLATVNPVSAATVLTSEEASKVIRFENLNITPSKVSGVIANKSPHTVKDVEILIQYHWLWENERNPGPESPGRAALIKLDRVLEPGQSVPFSYTPLPALPSRSDGRFMPEVDIAGFALIIPQQSAQIH
jgi:hypothetical protein